MSTRAPTQSDVRPGLLSYVAPAIVFSIFTAAESAVPRSMYPIAYVVKAIAVTVALYVCRDTLRDIVPSRRWLFTSVLIGLVVCVGWVGIEEMFSYPHIGSREAFDPIDANATITRPVFLAVRLYGLVLMVPVMEEVLWRSFVLRYATTVDFLTIPMGTFSPMALAVTVGLSALSHPEWIVAALTNAIYCLWIARTRSLFSTVVAHATTNAALGAYVLISHNWKYW